MQGQFRDESMVGPRSAAEVDAALSHLGLSSSSTCFVEKEDSHLGGLGGVARPKTLNPPSMGPTSSFSWLAITFCLIEVHLPLN